MYIDVDKLLIDELTHVFPVGFGKISGKVFIFADDIKNAPAADVVEVRKVNNFIQRLQNIPGAIYHSELRQICEEFGFDYPSRKMEDEEEANND